MQQGNYDMLIRKMYGEFEVGDLDRLEVEMPDDLGRPESGRNPPGGDHRGPDRVLAPIAGLKQRSGDTFQIEVLDEFSNAECAVALQRMTIASNGKSLDVMAAVKFEIHHGKATEANVSCSGVRQFDAFWSDVSRASGNRRERSGPGGRGGMMSAEEWVRTGQSWLLNGDASRRIDADNASGAKWEDVLFELFSSGREAGVTMPLVSDD